MTKKTASKNRRPKLTAKDRACDRLYLAVAHFVKTIGGQAIVTGGVEIQDWPGDLAMNFRVAVKCTGRPSRKVTPKYDRLR